MEPEVSIVLVKLWGFIHRCAQDVGLPFMPILYRTIPDVINIKPMSVNAQIWTYPYRHPRWHHRLRLYELHTSLLAGLLVNILVIENSE